MSSKSRTICFLAGGFIKILEVVVVIDDVKSVFFLYGQHTLIICHDTLF